MSAADVSQYSQMANAALSDIDLIFLVEEGIDEGKADGLRFRACRNCPQQAWLFGRKVRVDCFPLPLSWLRHFYSTDRFCEGYRPLHVLAQPFDFGVGQVAAMRQQFRTADARE